MGASNTTGHSPKSKKVSLFGRAISSSARVEILEHLLRKDTFTTNVELTRMLGITKSTVHDHLRKLHDANLISMDFFPNCYHIRIAEGQEEKITKCLSEICPEEL